MKEDAGTQRERQTDITVGKQQEKTIQKTT